MQRLHPATIIIIGAAAIYFLTGCSSTSDTTSRYRYVFDPPEPQPKPETVKVDWNEFAYGGRPRGYWSFNSHPFSFREQQRNPDRRSWSWILKK